MRDKSAHLFCADKDQVRARLLITFSNWQSKYLQLHLVDNQSKDRFAVNRGAKSSGSWPLGGPNVDKIILLGVVAVMAGCTSMYDGSYMPTAHQEELQNPHLLNCGLSIKVCNKTAGRLNVSRRMCRCH